MAYLGNTLINGSLRCLNKAYFNDLSIGNDVEITGKTTTNQLVISSDYNPSNLASANSSTTAIPLVIGNPTGVHIAMDADEIQFKNNATSNRAGYINYGGGRIYLSNGTKIYADNGVFKADSLGTSDSRIPNAYITTLDATTSNITTLNASAGTVQDLEVKNVLKSFKWDISNVANLANDFMIAPTIEIATDGKVSVSKSGSDYIFTFADSNTITSDEFAGCKWLDGSKVRFTTKINDKLFSDVYGTVTGNMNTNSGRLAVKTSLTEDDLTGVTLNHPYDAVGSTIMLYAITKTGDINIYPVGIHMTAYGTNNSYYIDMYGGNSPSSSGTKAQPVFRIGNLKGITYNGQTFQEAKWGVYTYNGYFEGAVVAKEGKIGEWIIDSKKIYTGTWGTANSAMMSPGTTSTDGNKSIGGSDSISGWTFTSGANFGVNKDGSLYANKGKIGGLTIDGNKLYTNGHSTYDSAKNGVYISTDYISFGNGGVTYFKNDGTGKIGTWIVGSNALTNGTWGSNNSAMVCTGSSTAKAIGGSDSISGWTFTSGANFGVTKEGALYANKGKIGNWVIETDRLHIGNIGDTTSVVLSTGVTSTTDIGGSGTRTSENALTWVFTAGNKFGVTNNGVLYANDVNVTGAVNATALHVGSSSSTNHLIYENSTIDLQTDWLRFDKTTKTATIGEINSPRVNIDGSSFYMQDMDNNVYFLVEDRRREGIYVFSEENDNADIVYPDSSTMIYSNYDIDTNYPVTVKLNGVEVAYTSIGHYRVNDDRMVGIIYGTGFDFESTYSLSYTTRDPVHSMRFGARAEATAPNAICFAQDGKASYANAFAIGDSTKASGRASFASGKGSISRGKNSFSTGEYSYAIGDNSLSLGYYCQADGANAVAFNEQTRARGDNSCAMGCQTKATGLYSYASGLYSVASNTCSSAMGEGTYATRISQTTIGKYNSVTIDTSWDEPLYDAGDYAFIIGNGTGKNNRSNALTVGWNGNVRSLASNVSMTSTPSSDTWIAHYNLIDSTGYGYGVIQGDFLANGETGITLQTQRKINNTYYQNHLSLHIKNDGTPVVTVGHPEKWRIALGVNIKTLSQNITTDQYGQCSVPSSLNGKTLLGIRTNNYQYGAFLIGNTNIRVFKISATPVAWAASVSVPLIFTYID